MNLVIYNIKGQKVTTLLAEEREAGDHQKVWNGRDDRGKEMASGVYFYQLKTGKESIIRKMMMMK